MAGICVGAAAVPAYLLHHLYFCALSLTFARYRYPIEPLMYALGGYFACELYADIRKKRLSSRDDASVSPA